MSTLNLKCVQTCLDRLHCLGVPGAAGAPTRRTGKGEILGNYTYIQGSSGKFMITTTTTTTYFKSSELRTGFQKKARFPQTTMAAAVRWRGFGV